MANTKSHDLAKQLDLELAWKRAKSDFPNRVFVRHPFEIQLIESDLPGWLAGLRRDLASGSYRPSPLTMCDAPKPNGAVRPAAHLQTNDRIVYASLVGACLPFVQQGLSWSQGKVDYSYLLSEDSEVPTWLKNQFAGWKQFERNTLSRLKGDVTHVLFTDITGYYENIVLEMLMSDLRQLGCLELVVVQLSSMFNRWAESPARGIPQGHSPSDILAKVYLNSIDESLNADGIIHLRYVDDFRVLCPSEVEAKKSLLRLTQLLRRRGLSLQTAKTEIVSVDAARKKIESLTGVLIQTRNRFIKQAMEVIQTSDYMNLNEVERLLEEFEITNPDDAPIHIIRETFDEHFGPDAAHFNKSLFHFILNRLGRAADGHAIEYCFELLSKHPEETKYVLRYFERTTGIPDWDDQIADFLRSPVAIYDYQQYQMLEWRLQDDKKCSDCLLSVIRDRSFDNSKPPYLQSMARALLSRSENTADLERFLEAYNHATDSLAQAELICCIKPMEIKRRNAFAARYRGDSVLHALANKYIKA